MSKPHKRRRGRVQRDLAAVDHDFVPALERLGFLREVDALIDWDAVRAPLLALYADVGRPATDPILLVKMMLLQRWFALSDPQCELQCNDRLSFRRFVGLHGAEPAPDETTLVRFRARLAAAGRATAPADEVMDQLRDAGLVVQEGRSVIVDGTLIRSQTNRGAKDENDRPIEPEATTQGRSDGRPPVHGYKMHLAVDEATGLALGETVTEATGSEREQLHVLCIEGDAELLADKGYAGRAVEAELRRKKVRNRVMRKKPRGGQLSEYARRRNQSIAARRGKVEGVFGILKGTMGLGRARYRGLAKVRAWCRWTTIAFNLRRLGRLGALRAALGWPALGWPALGWPALGARAGP